MNIESGMLVKTLSGSIVTTGHEIEPGYWYCDDGRTYLAVTFREFSDDEREVHAFSHTSQDASGE